MPTIINLTEEPSMMLGRPSSKKTMMVTVESQMQVKTSGGMPGLQCRAGGRIMTGGYIKLTMRSK
jgi:hypothetical protein